MTDAAKEPLSTLRGANVGPVNARRVALGIASLVLMILAVLVALLSVAGAHHNAQVSKLHRHGVTVDMTVSGCAALIGGSGSNPAGYSCAGTFTLGSHTYREPIPGSDRLTPGQNLRVVVVPGDPALLATAHSLAQEQSSWTVYILPGVLFVLLVLLAGGLVFHRHRHA